METPQSLENRQMKFGFDTTQLLLLAMLGTPGAGLLGFFWNEQFISPGPVWLRLAVVVAVTAAVVAILMALPSSPVDAMFPLVSAAALGVISHWRQRPQMNALKGSWPRAKSWQMLLTAAAGLGLTGAAVMAFALTAAALK